MVPKQSPNRGELLLKEKRKGNYKKKGEDKKENILNFSSRELSEADIKRSKANKRRILKLEEQQNYANA